MQRAYSLVTVKGFDPETRTFTGLATSPIPDRVGDTIDSKGVTFKNPLPLLLYHDKAKPVGEARFGKPSKDGTPFTALISTIDRDSGVVKERLDEAVDSLAAKPPLIRGVSIGFRALEDPEFDRSTGGFNFPKIEVLELSMVVIPAHQEATIDLVKSLDAASGVTTQPSAGVSALPRTVKAVPRGVMKKAIADQIKDFEATRLSKVADRDAIMEKAGDTGETLDAQQTEAYDTLQAEIKAIDAHLLRLTELQKEAVAAAKPVPTEPGAPRSPITVTSYGENREKGIGFARIVMAKMAAFMAARDGSYVSSIDIAKSWWPSDTQVHKHLVNAMQMKTAVAAATSQHATWAGPLVYADNLSSEFIEYLRPQTIIGQFGTNGVPGLRRVPFNVRIPRQTSGMTGYWVGEGKGKPVTSAALDSVTLTYTKAAAIAVITQELARFSSPSAEAWVRDELAKAVIARIDTDFIDPAISATSYVRPASITNGVTPLSTSGTSAGSVRTDIQNLLEAYLLLNLNPQDLVLIMPNTLAMVLATMVNSLGQREFPQMTITGGSLAGIPVVTSQYAANSSSYGNMVIAVKANDIALADDGRVSVDVSGEASIEMSDAPANESATPTASAYTVSMFQTNSLAVRAEREIHWAKLRSTAVVFFDDVNWGAIGSPA